MEQIIACLPATRVHFFQICTLTFGRPVPKFPFYSSTWEKQQKRIVGRVCTSGKQQNINTLLLPLRWQGCSLVTLVFSHPLINLHLNLSQTSWRLNLTTFSSERVLCVCVCKMVFCGYAWDGLDSEWSCGKLPRMERMACPFTNHNPTCKNQSVVSWPFIYQEKKTANTIFLWLATLYNSTWRLMASCAINLPQSSAQLFVCHSVIFLPLSPHLCQGFWFNHPKNTLFPIFPFQNATVFFRR